MVVQVFSESNGYPCPLSHKVYPSPVSPKRQLEHFQAQVQLFFKN